MRSRAARARAYHHGDLRSALVSAAVQKVEASGGQEFSLRETAREVGVSANAAYRHFDDRAALLTEVAKVGFERLARRMERAMAAHEGPGHARERFKACGRAYIAFAIAHPDLFSVMFGSCGLSCIDEGWAEGSSRVRSPYALLGEALDALVEEQAIPAAERPGAEFKAWSIVHGYARLILDGARHMPVGQARSRAMEDLLEFALEGLGGRSPGYAVQER